MGRNPVQRQMWPSKASSISCCVGAGLLRSSVNMFITKPGVQ
jgi:hypothetical protein